MTIAENAGDAGVAVNKFKTKNEATLWAKWLDMAMLIGQCVAFSAIHLLVHLFVTVTKTPQVRNIKNIPIKIIKVTPNLT